MIKTHVIQRIYVATYVYIITTKVMLDINNPIYTSAKEQLAQSLHIWEKQPRSLTSGSKGNL